jgi:hypothetical protein
MSGIHIVQKQTLAKGVSTGLQLWLLFLLGLFLLGYSAGASIGLGAIAGFAGGVIANWFQSKDEPSKEAEKAAADADADRQVPEGDIYQPSLLKKYALKRQKRKEWLKKWKNWKPLKDFKGWRKSS